MKRAARGDLKSVVTAACSRYENDRTRLLDILWFVQNRLGCINGESMERIAEAIDCHRIEVDGLVSFYAFLSDKPKGDIIIRLCDDVPDQHAGLEEVCAAFSDALGIGVGETTADGRFTLEYTPCIGMCDQAPAALINEKVVTSLTAEKAHRIVKELQISGDLRGLSTPTGDGNNANPLILSQVQNNIRLKGELLLTELPAELGLAEALTHSPESTIQTIIDSDLRGRGGAGFPAGQKFRLTASTNAERRYVICNADEGEPGTFKDRVLLTEYPDLVFEGMTIAAYGIGSKYGILYLRAEYAYLLPFLEDRLEQRRNHNLLGKDICGKKGLEFDIRIQLGAGAYICGEESALIGSCEGLRGRPKTRPPFPAEKGYLEYPTAVNNVETFCCISRIMALGSERFASFGTEKSRGTKLLSVSGDCDRPGIYEVPFGLTVREVIEMVGGHGAAIVQVGGASGHMIGRASFGRRICFEDLATGGAVTIFNSSRNVLKIVDSYLQFFVDESCGFCTPCRVGVVFLQERVRKIMNGFAEAEDLDYLIDLSNTIMVTSRCGLGNTSPKALLSSMHEFPLVYATHLHKRKEGREIGFDIQNALVDSRRIAKRRSMIYDPVYDEKQT